MALSFLVGEKGEFEGEKNHATALLVLKILESFYLNRFFLTYQIEFRRDKPHALPLKNFFAAAGGLSWRNSFLLKIRKLRLEWLKNFISDV